VAKYQTPKFYNLAEDEKKDSKNQGQYQKSLLVPNNSGGKNKPPFLHSNFRAQLRNEYNFKQQEKENEKKLKKL
jgi:hypothetical protein